jgi:hypothetical protein
VIVDCALLGKFASSGNSGAVLRFVCFWHKADIRQSPGNVRFRHKADILPSCSRDEARRIAANIVKLPERTRGKRIPAAVKRKGLRRLSKAVPES